VAKRGYVLVVAGALIVFFLVVALVLVLSSGTHHSNSDYVPFAECPLSNPATDICIFAQAESGELTIGHKTIPITKTITLQGGVHQAETGGKQEFIGAQNGETLSIAPQVIPGGLKKIIGRGTGQVTATIQLAAPSSAIGVNTQNLIEAKGVGLSLPVKLKLSNALLGESCYIGSNAHPIVINLTTGLTGKPGHAKFKDQYNLATLTDESLLSTSFAVPRATGCGGARSSRLDPAASQLHPASSRLNAALDAGLGLPIAPTNSQARLNGTLRDANAPAVKASRRP
jgi:hypothetical protein